MLYKITTTDGEILGLTENVQYISKSENNILIPSTAYEAIGISFHSTPYNLIGHNEILEAKTVTITEVDQGELFYNALQTTFSNNLMLSNIKYTPDYKTYYEKTQEVLK